MSQIIEITVYNSSGNIDNTLSPVISIYDNTTSQQVVNNDTVTWNTERNMYIYIFSSYDDTHNYSCNIYFGSSAMTKYSRFAIGGGIVAGGLTSEQAQQLQSASNALQLGEFIALK